MEYNKSLYGSNSNGSDLKQHVSIAYLFRGVASISLAMITSIGNGLVIYIFLKDPLRNIRKSRTNILVTSLACVDFLVGFFLEPLATYWFLTTYLSSDEPFQRKHLELIEVYLLLVSVFHLLAITRDRHLAILHPMKYSIKKVSKKRSYSIVVIIWVYCLILATGLSFIKNFLRNIVFCLHIDLTVGTSIFMFYRVMRSLKRQTLSLRNLNAQKLLTIRSVQRERKVTKTMGIMLSVFLICTLPWFLLMQVLPVCPTCRLRIDKLLWAFQVFFVLFQTNCALNPFLCAWRLSAYKHAIKSILVPRRPRYFQRKVNSGEAS